MAEKHIIIVEDTQELGRLLKVTLTTLEKSLRVSVVPGREEALEEARQKGVDLLVTDFQLGGSTGRDLGEKIRLIHPNTRVILIAPKAQTAILRQEGLHPYEAVLHKPMDIEDFKVAAKRFLNIGTGALPEEDLPATGSDLLPALTELKGNLNALAVCLADKQGTIIAKVGEFPERNFESRWLPVILSNLEGDTKMTNLFSAPVGDGLHAYMGPSFQLVYMTLDDCALVAALKPEQGHNHLLMSLGVVIDTQRELIKMISGKALRASPRRGSSLEAAAPKDEFDALLQQSSSRLNTADMERFWETGEEDGTVGIEGITFEDAEKMGLMSKDKEAKTKKK